MNGNVVLPVLFAMAGLIYAQDSSYTRESKLVFDQARLIEARKFEASALRKEFLAFVAGRCAGRTLARLILAPTKDDLARAVNANFLDLSPETEARIASSWPSVFGAGGGSPRVAQVLCFGGNSTVRIRNGNDVTRYQISGPHDSREWSFHGVEVTIVGFSFFSQDIPLGMFVRAELLPNVNAAAAIRDELQRQTRVDTSLVFRADPFFWAVNGPQCDIFEVPTPKIAGGEFLKRPYVECPPGGEPGACQVKTPR
jgi:hypothetical protein